VKITIGSVTIAVGSVTVGIAKLKIALGGQNSLLAERQALSTRKNRF
jgi:hypothetical protein